MAMMPIEAARQFRTAARTKAWCLICFVLGLLLVNYPILQIFNQPLTLFGFPLLVMYLLGFWLLSIAVLFLLTRLLLKFSDKN
jgi:hypothetical protein